MSNDASEATPSSGDLINPALDLPDQGAGAYLVMAQSSLLPPPAQFNEYDSETQQFYREHVRTGQEWFRETLQDQTRRHQETEDLEYRVNAQLANRGQLMLFLLLLIALAIGGLVANFADRTSQWVGASFVASMAAVAILSRAMSLSLPAHSRKNEK